MKFWTSYWRHWSTLWQLPRYQCNRFVNQSLAIPLVLSFSRFSQTYYVFYLVSFVFTRISESAVRPAKRIRETTNIYKTISLCKLRSSTSFPAVFDGGREVTLPAIANGFKLRTMDFMEPPCRYYLCNLVNPMFLSAVMPTGIVVRFLPRVNVAASRNYQRVYNAAMAMDLFKPRRNSLENW